MFVRICIYIGIYICIYVCMRVRLNALSKRAIKPRVAWHHAARADWFVSPICSSRRSPISSKEAKLGITSARIYIYIYIHIHTNLTYVYIYIYMYILYI